MTESAQQQHTGVTTTPAVQSTLMSDLMKTLCHILLLTLFSLAAHADAAESSAWWERPLVTRAATADAPALLASALYQEKALGNLESAAADYRRVLELYRQRRTDATTAVQARDRLRYLRESGLLPPDLVNTEPDLAGRGAGGLVRVTRRLQLAPSRGVVATAAGPAGVVTPATATGGLAGGGAGGATDPLRSRRRWLNQALRLQSKVGHGPRAPSWLIAFGSGLEAVRTALGLRGVPYYVESQLRQSRDRSMTPHERYLVALEAEKEQRDFDGAARHYRELVQLNLTGGIATRLSERARRGLERCQSWQRSVDTGS